MGQRQHEAQWQKSQSDRSENGNVWIIFGLQQSAVPEIESRFTRHLNGMARRRCKASMGENALGKHTRFGKVSSSKTTTQESDSSTYASVAETRKAVAAGEGLPINRTIRTRVVARFVVSRSLSH